MQANHKVVVLFFVIGLWFVFGRASEDETFLSEWTLDSNKLPNAMSRHFAVYNEKRDTIFGVGGTSCTSCAYAYNLTSNMVENFTIDPNISVVASNGFLNGDVCNAELIDDDTMMIMGYNGNIWQFDIETRIVTLINSEQQGAIYYGCMVTNYPSNTHLYACNGDGGQTCYQYTISTDSWIQIADLPSDKGTFSRQSCVFNDNIFYVFAGGPDLVYMLNTSDAINNNFTAMSNDVNMTDFGVPRYSMAVVVDNRYIFNAGSLASNRTFRINIESETAVEEASLPQTLYHGPGVYVPRMKRIYYLGGLIDVSPQINQDSIYYADVINAPTYVPTGVPTSVPTSEPSSDPSSNPSNQPTLDPTWLPTSVPTSNPTRIPSSIPSSLPSSMPSSMPSSVPSSEPSNALTGQPSPKPSIAPSKFPTTMELTTTENEENENGQSSSSGGGNSDTITQTIILLVVLFGIILLLVCLCFIIYIYVIKRKAKQNENSKNIELTQGGDIESNDRSTMNRMKQIKNQETLHSQTNDTSDLVALYDDTDISNALNTPVPQVRNMNVTPGADNDMDINLAVSMASALSRVSSNGDFAGEGNGNHDMYGEGGSNVTGMNNNMRETGEIVNVNNKQLKIHDNYENWGSNDINAWLEMELKHAKFDAGTINAFMNQFREIDMTGMILQSWLKESNGDKDRLLTKLQSKIHFKPKSLVWDVVIQVMMNL